MAFAERRLKTTAIPAGPLAVRRSSLLLAAPPVSTTSTLFPAQNSRSLRPGSSSNASRPRSRSRSRTDGPEATTSGDAYMTGALPPPPASYSDNNMTALDQDHESAMGDYSDDPPEDGPKYTVKSSAPPPGGMPGVKYAEPMVLSYTPYPQFGSAASLPSRTVNAGYNAPPGEYKYADPPKEIRFTSKPVVPKKKRVSIYDEDDFRRPEESDYADVPAMPAYNVVTVEPGKPHKRSNAPYPPQKHPMLPPGMPPPPHQHPMLPPGVPPPPPPPFSGASGGIRGPPLNHSSIPPYPEEPRFRDTRGRNPSPPRTNSHRLSTGMLPDMRGPSPSDMSRRQDRLSVSGDRPNFVPGSMPPPSPMLEAYRGTWQSMPGMPSPIARPLDDFDDDGSYYDDRHDRDDVSRLDQLSPRHSSSSVNVGAPRGVTFTKVEPRGPIRRPSESSRRSNSPKRMDKPKKSVSMYNAENDAQEIARELTKQTSNFHVLSDILPFLSHDQIIELHTAYKRVAKFQGRGINIAKHIRLKVPGHLRTIAYVTALGRWESEGYWANYWYQSNSSKRELLIESLMGRTNNEIHFIKENFRDKRYGDSLVRCMDKELPANKFRTAILMALEEKRQPEKEVWPRDEVEKDADVWARSLRRREGGESAMLEICVMRSDRHLRECMRVFEKRENGNFAKQALERSGNLVGEVMAHILNGVINRPARDAMLLHHALMDLRDLRERRSSGSGEESKDASPRASATRLNPFSAESRAEREREREREREEKREKERLKEDRKDRYELLISRLVRLHWDQIHLRKVKEEYNEKYGARLDHDIEDHVKPGEFQEFCLNLVEG